MIHGNQVEKTIFSSHLTPEEVWDTAVEFVGNVTEITAQGNRIRYLATAKNGTRIVIIAEAEGEVVTFYPKSFTTEFGKR